MQPNFLLKSFAHRSNYTLFLLSSLGQPTVKNFPEEDSKDERKTSCVYYRQI